MNPFRVEPPFVVSFSGGRTSGYMLWRVLRAWDGALPEGGHVVFANTGKERLETLDFVRDCATRWGVSIRWVERDGKAPRGRRFREVEYATASRRGEPFAELIAERQFLPNAVMRICTQALKVETARDFMRAQGHAHWTNLVGLRADEPGRVARVRARDESGWDTVCPLADARITKPDVMDFWRSQPFDLALRPHESNCDGCFLRGPGVLEQTEREHPGTLAWWSAQETERRATFRKGWTYARIIERAQRRPTLPLLDLDAGEIEPPCNCTD